MKTKFLALLFSVAAVSTAFVSCNDDDDDAGSGSVSSNSFYDIDGQRVKSVGNMFRCSYDEEGNLLTYYLWGRSAETSFNPFKLTWYDTYDNSVVYEFGFNKDGLISTMTNKYSLEDYSGNQKATISYNSNNQVSSISISASGKEYYDGKTYSYSGNGTYKFTYSGSVLKSVYAKYTGSDSGTETIEFIYKDEIENAYRQYTPNYAEAVFGEDIHGLAFIGMFGNASSMLPDRIEVEGTYDDYYEDEDSYSYNCYYTFMSNGAIKSADGYDYTYTTVDTRANYVEEYTPVMMGEKRACRPFGLMGRRHHRK